MKSYLLLRDNQESGPYTIEDLKKEGLQPQDLVWIEGESNCWKFPGEIEELKAFIKAPEKKKVAPKKSHTASSVPVAKAGTSTPAESEQAPVVIMENQPAGDYGYYSEQEAKELFADFKLQSTVKRRYSLGSNLVALLVLAIGVAMTAYVVRSIVLSFGGEPLQSAQATEIQSVSYESEHAAYGGAQPQVQHAIYREMMPLPPTEKTEEVKPADEKAKEPEKPEATTEAKKATPEPDKKENVEVKKEEPVLAEKKEAKEEDVTNTSDEPKEDKPAKQVSKSDVKVSGNGYTVGMLGGISGLKINVSNSGSATIGKATVEVKYLKKNGNVVHTETVQVQNIKPGGSKSVQVPDSNRGTKVDYRVVNVEAASK